MNWDEANGEALKFIGEQDYDMRDLGELTRMILETQESEDILYRELLSDDDLYEIVVKSTDYKRGYRDIYLRSWWWKFIRDVRKSYDECRCYKCNDIGNDYHHLTYKRLGTYLEFFDIRCICRKCHKLIHLNN